MLKTSIGASLSALFLVSAMSFASLGAAHAESVMKQCGDDWKAAKAAGSTNGQTWKEFLAGCRAKKEATTTPAITPVSAPAAAPAPAPAPAPTLAPAVAPAPKATIVKPKVAPAIATGAGEFPTEAEAKGHCPTDMVVWVNLGSKGHKYHFSGSKYYGSTKKGAYMCQAEANAAGAVAAKNEKPK